MKPFTAFLALLALDASGQSFNVTAPITITPPAGGTCVQTSTFAFSCSGGAIPQCPSPPGPGPCGGPTDCPGFANTEHITLDWNNPVRKYTTSFNQNSALVIKFTTGSATSVSLPAVAGGEWQTQPQGRFAVLSPTACDFGNQPAAGAISSGTTFTNIFSVNNPNITYGYYPLLKTNTTYYVNVKNIAPLVCQVCNVFVELQKGQ